GWLKEIAGQMSKQVPARCLPIGTSVKLDGLSSAHNGKEGVVTDFRENNGTFFMLIVSEGKKQLVNPTNVVPADCVAIGADVIITGLSSAASVRYNDTAGAVVGYKTSSTDQTVCMDVRAYDGVNVPLKPQNVKERFPPGASAEIFGLRKQPLLNNTKVVVQGLKSIGEVNAIVVEMPGGKLQPVKAGNLREATPPDCYPIATEAEIHGLVKMEALNGTKVKVVGFASMPDGASAMRVKLPDGTSQAMRSKNLTNVTLPDQNTTSPTPSEAASEALSLRVRRQEDETKVLERKLEEDESNKSGQGSKQAEHDGTKAREEEERKKRQEEEKQKKAEEQQKRDDAERAAKQEEERRQQEEEESKRREEEERKRQEAEETTKQAESERARQEEEGKKREEAERRKQEEEREETKRQQEKEESQREEDERKKKEEESEAAKKEEEEKEASDAQKEGDQHTSEAPPEDAEKESDGALASRPQSTLSFSRQKTEAQTGNATRKQPSVTGSQKSGAERRGSTDDTIGSKLRRGMGSLSHIPTTVSIAGTPRHGSSASSPALQTQQPRTLTRIDSLTDLPANPPSNASSASQGPLDFSFSRLTPSTLDLTASQVREHPVEDTWFQRLDSVYTRHAPTKKNTMNILLSKYDNREDVLFDALAKKFKDTSILKYRDPKPRDDLQQRGLGMVAKMRSLHNTSELVFDQSLALLAQKAVASMAQMATDAPPNVRDLEQTILQSPDHSHNTGLNIFYKDVVTTADTECSLAEEAISAWYGEMPKYDSNNALATADEARHFVQLIWKSCESAGVAVLIKRRMAYVAVVFSHKFSEKASDLLTNVPAASQLESHLERLHSKLSHASRQGLTDKTQTEEQQPSQVQTSVEVADAVDLPEPAAPPSKHSLRQQSNPPPSVPGGSAASQSNKEASGDGIGRRSSKADSSSSRNDRRPSGDLLKKHPSASSQPKSRKSQEKEGAAIEEEPDEPAGGPPKTSVPSQGATLQKSASSSKLSDAKMVKSDIQSTATRKSSEKLKEPQGSEKLTTGLSRNPSQKAASVASGKVGPHSVASLGGKAPNNPPGARSSPAPGSELVARAPASVSSDQGLPPGAGPSRRGSALSSHRSSTGTGDVKFFDSDGDFVRIIYEQEDTEGQLVVDVAGKRETITGPIRLSKGSTEYERVLLFSSSQTAVTVPLNAVGRNALRLLQQLLLSIGAEHDFPPDLVPARVQANKHGKTRRHSTYLVGNITEVVLPDGDDFITLRHGSSLASPAMSPAMSYHSLGAGPISPLISAGADPHSHDPTAHRLRPSVLLVRFGTGMPEKKVGKVRLLQSDGLYHLHFPEMKRVISIPGEEEVFETWALLQGVPHVAHNLPAPPGYFTKAAGLAAALCVLLTGWQDCWRKFEYAADMVAERTGSPSRKARHYLKKHGSISKAIEAIHANEDDDSGSWRSSANLRHRPTLPGTARSTDNESVLVMVDNAGNPLEATVPLALLNVNNPNPNLYTPRHTTNGSVHFSPQSPPFTPHYHPSHGQPQSVLSPPYSPAPAPSPAMPFSNEMKQTPSKSLVHRARSVVKRAIPRKRAFPIGWHLQFYRREVPLRGIGFVIEIHNRLSREAAAPYCVDTLNMTLLADTRVVAALFPELPVGENSPEVQEELWQLGNDGEARRLFLESYQLALKSLGLEVDLKSGRVWRPAQHSADAGWSRPADCDRFRMLNTKNGAGLRKVITRVISSLHVFNVSYLAPPFVTYLVLSVVDPPNHLLKCKDAAIKWVTVLQDMKAREQLFNLLTAANVPPWRTSTSPMSHHIPNVPPAEYPAGTGTPRAHSPGRNSTLLLAQQSALRDWSSTKSGHKQVEVTPSHHSILSSPQKSLLLSNAKNLTSRSLFTPGSLAGTPFSKPSASKSLALGSITDVLSKTGTKNIESALLQWLACAAKQHPAANGLFVRQSALPPIRLEEDAFSYRLIVKGPAASTRVALTDSELTIWHVGDARPDTVGSRVLVDELSAVTEDNEVMLSPAVRTITLPCPVEPSKAKKEPYGRGFTICRLPKCHRGLSVPVDNDGCFASDGEAVLDILSAARPLSPRRPTPSLRIDETSSIFRFLLRGPPESFTIHADVSSVTITQEAQMVPPFTTPETHILIDELSHSWTPAHAKGLTSQSITFLTQLQTGNSQQPRLFPSVTRILPLSRPVLSSKMQIRPYGFGHTAVVLPILPADAPIDL
ncbi:Reticulocyte-binding protein 2-like protein a, partial [Diplonema papillatum]